MKEITLGDRTFRLIAIQKGGGWVAQAERADNGDRFGPEYSATAEDQAIGGLQRWLEWQHEHVTALEALQQAERAYHRVIAGSAFADPTEGPTPIEIQKEALDKVEAARVRLDDIRSRRPD